MPEINFLNGMTEEEVEERRRNRFHQLTPEDKIQAFFSLVQLSLDTRQGPLPPRAKITLRKRGYSE